MMANAMPGRLRLVAHSVREIANRLPDYLDGGSGSERLDYTDQVDDLARRCREAGISFDTIGSEPQSAGPPVDALIPMPVQIHRQLGQLVLAHEVAAKRVDDKTVRLFTVIAPDSTRFISDLRPAFKKWNECRRWFTGVVHDPGPDGSPESRAEREAELPERFETFESLLASLVGSFYRTVSGLDDILAEANRPRD
jgi:hypothetical protein